VSFQDIHLSKSLDHLSLPLMTQVATGRHLRDVQLSFYDVSDPANRRLIGTNTYVDALVSSFQTGGQTVGAIIDQVSFNFAVIRSMVIVDGVTYTSCFNAATNLACN
jgi:type VI protein secretion system component Hcp